MNKNLFNTSSVPAADTVNHAGGKAYSLLNELALLQLAVTGVFNDTFYVKAGDQLNRVIDLADNCSAEWVARVAIYARQQGFMKDMPAVLVALLSVRNTKLFHYTFDKVIDNVGMLRNFVQVVRSGVTGRKSLGSAPKKAAARFLNSLSGDKLFFQSAGNNPSIQDVLKLVHPRPIDSEHDALFGYLLEKEYVGGSLPATVLAFEEFMSGMSKTIPHVDFRRLTALPLTKEQWSTIGLQMTWNQLRLNLNTLARHGCFDDIAYTQRIAEKLTNPEAVTKAKVLPFALYTAIENLSPEVPASVRNALGACMDASLLNAPVFDKKTLVLIDSSGSMSSPVTGRRDTATTELTCATAAAYFGASLLKRNPDLVTVIPFDTEVHPISVNPRDSLETITRSLTRNGGGTDVSCGIRWATAEGAKWENILIISDNESWFDTGSTSWRGTNTSKEWMSYKAKQRNARLVCWDITPNTTTVVKDDKSTLNVGGWTESVYDLVDFWFNNQGGLSLIAELNKYPLE